MHYRLHEVLDQIQHDANATDREKALVVVINTLIDQLDIIYACFDDFKKASERIDYFSKMLDAMEIKSDLDFNLISY